MRGKIAFFVPYDRLNPPAEQQIDSLGNGKILVTNLEITGRQSLIAARTVWAPAEKRAPFSVYCFHQSARVPQPEQPLATGTLHD
jgi:hypothetical protein